MSRLETVSLSAFDALLKNRPEGERWELVNGRILRGMVGGRWEHERVCGNLYIALQRHLRRSGSPCRAFKETFYVRRAADDLALLPDLLVACGGLSAGATSVTEPLLIVEVLSPSTRQRDRQEKWAACRAIPSLQHYVLVRPDLARVEVWSRAAGEWQAQELTGLAATLSLPALGFAMPLADLYEDVLSA